MAVSQSPSGPVETRRVEVAPGVSLAVDHLAGSSRPFVLVHGLASNRQLWAGVARGLADAGHEVVAIDLRGHGESDAPATGYTTDTAAHDVSVVMAAYSMVGDRAPVVAGQSWGGQVVVRLASAFARGELLGEVHALALVDGGWIRLQGAFPDWDACAQVLAPPDLSSIPAEQLRSGIGAMHPDWEPWALEATLANLRVDENGRVSARLSREHHLEILRSMWEHDPRQDYPRIAVPVLLMPAYGESEMSAMSPGAVAEALGLLANGRVSEYFGGDHDLHAQQPQLVARDLLSLANVN